MRLRSHPLLMALAATSAIALGGCQRSEPERRTWNGPGPMPFSGEAWQSVSLEDIYRQGNDRQAMVESLLWEKWTHKSLIEVLRILGNPDFTVQAEEVEPVVVARMVRGLGEERKGFGNSARLAVGYRYFVSGGDGYTLSVVFVLDGEGRVIAVERIVD